MRYNMYTYLYTAYTFVHSSNANGWDNVTSYLLRPRSLESISTCVRKYSSQQNVIITYESEKFIYLSANHQNFCSSPWKSVMFVPSWDVRRVCVRTWEQVCMLGCSHRREPFTLELHSNTKIIFNLNEHCNVIEQTFLSDSPFFASTLGKRVKRRPLRMYGIRKVDEVWTSGWKAKERARTHSISAHSTE